MVSVVGQGTTFFVYLPLVSVADSLNENAYPDDSEAFRGTERILLVDDEPAIVAMVSSMLRDLGYEVVAFNRSVEALAYFQEHGDALDLVITDITMPELTGIMMAREMANLRADLPLILCTGFSTEFTGEKLKLPNVVNLLTKPILKQDLARAVRTALDGKCTLKNLDGCDA